MAIMVQYKDNTFGHVQNAVLDELIESGSIVAFRRNSGWAEIGIDPLRSAKASIQYEGEERRIEMANRNCLTCPDFVESLCTLDVCPFRLSLQGKSS